MSGVLPLSRFLWWPWDLKISNVFFVVGLQSFWHLPHIFHMAYFFTHLSSWYFVLFFHMAYFFTHLSKWNFVLFFSHICPVDIFSHTCPVDISSYFFTHLSSWYFVLFLHTFVQLLFRPIFAHICPVVISSYFSHICLVDIRPIELLFFNFTEAEKREQKTEAAADTQQNTSTEQTEQQHTTTEEQTAGE